MRYILEIFIVDSILERQKFIHSIGLISRLNSSGLLNNKTLAESYINKWIKIDTDDDMLLYRHKYLESIELNIPHILELIRTELVISKNLGISCDFYSVVDKREDNFKELFK